MIPNHGAIILALASLAWPVVPAGTLPGGRRPKDPSNAPHLPRVERLETAIPLPQRSVHASMPKLIEHPSPASIACQVPRPRPAELNKAARHAIGLKRVPTRIPIAK